MKRVAVIGLGLAGLRAVQLLEAEGYQVVGLEARDRVGGRVQTVVDGAGFFEAGGEWIDAHQERMLGLLAEYGLEPETLEENETLYWFEEKNSVEYQDWTEVQAELGVFYDRTDELCLDLEWFPSENILGFDLDRRTVADYIRENRLSPVTEKILRGVLRSEEGEEAERISLLGWLCGLGLYRDRASGESSPMRVPGGVQRLCERMLGGFQSEVRLSNPVNELKQGPNEVLVDGDSFSAAVITLPPSVLMESIEYQPGWTPRKLEALQAFRMGRVIKVALRYRSKWWKEIGWTGRLLSDRLLQQCWDGSRGENAVLLAYVTGDMADRVRQEGDAGRALNDCLSELFPGARDEYLGSELFDWVDDSWSQGGFPHFAPESVLGNWNDLRAPEGRLFFAGDSTSPYIGYMEGALESAERAVREVIEKI